MDNENMVSFQPYYLTALDHLLMPAYVHVFLSFQIENHTLGISTLENSISALISEWPFLAGIITRSSTRQLNSHILEVQPPSAFNLHESPLLQVKFHQGKLADIPLARRLPEGFVPVETTTPTPYPTPALRFQANVMADGLVLCVSWHHRFMDAVGCTTVLDSLAQLCQGKDKSKVRFQTSSQEQEAMRARLTTFRTSEINVKSYYGAYGPSGYRYRNDQASRNYTLCPKRVECLKAMCNALASSSNRSSDPPLTSDDIVTALLWICCGRAHCQGSKSGVSSELQSWSLTRYVNVRKILLPSLPSNYLGNAILVSRLHCSVHELDLGGMNMPTPNQRLEVSTPTLSCFRQLARRVRSANDSIDSEHVKGIIAHVNSLGNWDSFVISSADMSVSSMRRLPLYNLSFGPVFGRPVDIEILDASLQGQCVIKPARGRGIDIPWEIRIALPEEVHQRLEEDDFFAWARGVDRPRL